MNRDSIRLLRECNAGIKMGASAIAKVMPHVKDPELKSALGTCRETHNELGSRAHKLLKEAREDTKSTHPIAQMMSDAKVTMAVMMGGGDKKIDLPIKIRAITVGMNRYKLDLLDFKETDRTILIRDVGGIEE